MNRHKRALVLMLRIFGVLVLLFAGLGLVMSILWLISGDGGSAGSVLKLIKSLVGAAIGVCMWIGAGAIKKTIQ